MELYCSLLVIRTLSDNVLGGGGNVLRKQSPKMRQRFFKETQVWDESGTEYHYNYIHIQENNSVS